MFRGTKTLQEILGDRENISRSMQVHLDEGTDPWGVKVERVEMLANQITSSFLYSLIVVSLEKTFAYLSICNVVWLLKRKVGILFLF